MGRAVFVLVFAVLGAAVAVSAARTALEPQRWTRGEGRWVPVLFAKPRRDPATPGAGEIRLWALVWVAVGFAVIAVGLAVGLMFDPG